ncbi:MAG: oxygenase MpaB family protein [Acidimicrobiia bacterium]|nr:oxygenase MpaB family protein [Acidimicrobiia bacterium]
MTMIDDAKLDELREQGDPEADDLAGHYLDRPPTDMFSGIMAARYGGTSMVDPHVAEWMENGPDLPDWADRDRLANGAEFFAQHGIQLGLGLFLSSLPLAYASHDGVQVLALTSRLETDSKRRVLESAQFVLDVTKPGALEPGEQGYDSARSVRLMHAGVRHLIEDDGRIPIVSDDSVWPRWDRRWGTPINQEHLIGAMISYCSSLLHVLDKLGAHYTEEDAEDYCLLWNVVGWLLGIDADLLPLDRAALDELEIAIRRRNEKASDAGTEMAEALIELVKSFIPFPPFKGFAVTVTRYFIGDDTADILELPQANWTRHVAGGLRDVSHHISMAAAENWLLRVAVRRLSMLTLRGFVDHERDGDRPKFVIPERLTPMKRTTKIIQSRPAEQMKQAGQQARQAGQKVSQLVRRTVPEDPA